MDRLPGSDKTSYDDICFGLCHVLGNSCRLARTSETYAWNVTGAGSVEIERVLLAQVAELQAGMTDVAHQITALGGAAILDYSDLIMEISPPGRGDGLPKPTVMLQQLMRAHEQAALSVEAVGDVAIAFDEPMTQQMMAGRLRAHRQHHFQLRRMLPA